MRTITAFVHIFAPAKSEYTSTMTLSYTGPCVINITQFRWFGRDLAPRSLSQSERLYDCSQVLRMNTDWIISRVIGMASAIVERKPELSFFRLVS